MHTGACKYISSQSHACAPFSTLANLHGLPILLSSSSLEGADDIMSDQQDRIIRLATVLDRTGLSRSTLYRKMNSGSFPRSIAISTRCAGWRESAVNTWIRNPMFYSVDDYPDA